MQHAEISIMRSMFVLAAVLLAACDPATTNQHAEVAQAGSASGASGSSEHSSGSSESSGSGSSEGHVGQTALPRGEPPRASPAEAAKVEVFEAATLKEATEVLGVVDVHEPGHNDKQGLEIMRERAAAMHADAVIGVEFHRDDKDFTDLSGLAVRYHDLLRNRQYDTLGVIKVHEGEGKDGDAMGELQRRAGAMNADLIIDISWHDNDAEKDGTYLSGTAIKYR
jgi:uncharacterized protein YbjQ (UPF0145 family)